VDLSLTEARLAGQVVLDVRGEVDLHSAPQLADRLSMLIQDGLDVLIVDLTELSFIDSTGLGALVATLNQADAAGVSLRIVCSSERLLKLFRITGLDDVFQMFGTVAEATSPD
jgi:anti-sigma B factor antagonist